MTCCDYIPPLACTQTQCHEIPPRVQSVRVYRRLPRKLKKQLKKKQRVHGEALMLVARACSIASGAMYAYQQWMRAISGRMALSSFKVGGIVHSGEEQIIKPDGSSYR